MVTRLPVLLFDDGELEDVREILRQLGVAFGQVRGEVTPGEMERAVDLIVATADRLCEDAGDRQGAQRIAVLSEGASAPREALRTRRIDYLVRRPVHPEALRLLLLRCLYGGDERRRETRLPVGSETLVRVDGTPRRVALLDLSQSGCRLLGSVPLELGKAVELPLPGPDADPQTLNGRSVRSSLRRSPEGDERFETVVVFDPPGPRLAAALERILARRERGPARYESPTDPVPETPRSVPVPDGERRGEERGRYERSVADFGGRALRVLVGRDLSLGGMRIQRFPGLERGDRVRLALYGSPEEGPVVTSATVQRDAGGSGMALVFDALRPRDRTRLAKLVASLPSIESLGSDAADTRGEVLGAMIEP